MLPHRLRHVPEGFLIPHPVRDPEFVQLMLALRLFLPEAGFTLSTREDAAFRDRLLPLGVTLMSAGSSTRPGSPTCGGSPSRPRTASSTGRNALTTSTFVRRWSVTSVVV